MRKMQWITAAMVMGLMMSMAGCGNSSKPGGETPKAVLTQAGDAITANDAAALAKCFAPKSDKQKADPAQAAKLLLTLKRTSSVLDAAQKKYGDQASQSLGMTGFMLAMMSHMPDMKTVAEKGEIKIDGDKATASYSEKGEGDSAKMSQDIPLTKIDGRWYLSMSDMEDEDAPAKMSQFAEALTKLLDAMDSATKANDDAAKYAEQIKPAVADFEKVMKETMK